MYKIMEEHSSGIYTDYRFVPGSPEFSREADAVKWAADKVGGMLPGSEVSTTRVERGELMGFFPADNGRGVEVKASTWSPVFWWQSRELYVVPVQA